MKHTLSFVALLVLGGCNADHSLGYVDQDAGPGPSKLDTAPSFIDWHVYVDAPVMAPTSDGAVTQPGPNSGPDARVIGQLGPTQSWTGWVENYQFSSDSAAIKFSFAADPAGQIVGQVVFGGGPLLSPPTDPNVGYPPGCTDWSCGQIEGFSFSTVSGSFVSGRLRLAVDENEIWKDWCALQTPNSSSTDCLPPVYGVSVDTSFPGHVCTILDSNNQPTVTIDCGKWWLCSCRYVCYCSTAGCSVVAGGPTSLDLAVSDGIASGSLSLGGSEQHNVHFTKDP